MTAETLQLIILPAGIIAVLFALYLARDVLARDTDVYGVDLGIRTGIAFLVGAACSMASGIIGMYISVRSNVRTAAAARRSLVEAVQVAMRGGAVSGFLVVALSLLGVYGYTKTKQPWDMTWVDHVAFYRMATAMAARNGY